MPWHLDDFYHQERQLQANRGRGNINISYVFSTTLKLALLGEPVPNRVGLIMGGPGRGVCLCAKAQVDFSPSGIARISVPDRNRSNRGARSQHSLQVSRSFGGHDRHGGGTLTRYGSYLSWFSLVLAIHFQCCSS